MKLLSFLTMVLFILFCSFSNSPSEKLKSEVSKYIKEKVKNPNSYNSLYFSSIDTTHDEFYRDSIMIKYKHDYKFKIDNIYEIENSDKVKIKMTVSFHFDSILKIIGNMIHIKNFKRKKWTWQKISLISYPKTSLQNLGFILAIQKRLNFQLWQLMREWQVMKSLILEQPIFNYKK